jgi:Protein of unknown function (DUF541)
MFQHRIFSLTLTLAALATGSFMGTPSLAQTAEASSMAASDGSLSVTGISQMSAPADQALVILTYYPNTYYAGDYSESNPAPQLPQVQPSDLKTVVDAVVAMGVPAANVRAYPDLASPGSMKVRLMLNQPTQARLEQIIETANVAVTKGSRYVTSGAVVGYTVSDCQTIEDQARRAAMVDAQNRAEALAEVAGAQVGPVFSLSESVSWSNNYSTTCPSSSDPAAYSDIYSLPMYDPAVPPVVKVLYSLSASYGMR